jgi:hypothetical protein
MKLKDIFEKRATAIGSYWCSNYGKSILKQHLRDCAQTFFKEASIGGEQEQGFEQAFSSLAYAYLKDKSPRLLDYIVGFQLVDRNEDNTKAIGVFGFKVGDQWLYAPTFFLNGDLKGHELLYIKKQDAFVPMKENWVNYLISRKPHVLGEGSEMTTHQLGGLTPNLMRLARPPIGTKYGSDTLRPEVQEWAIPFIPFAMSLMLKQAKSLYPEHVKTAGDKELNFKAITEQPFKAAMASTASRFDLRNFLGEFPLLKTAFEQCYMRYPLIKQGFDRFYGPNFFKEMAETQKQSIDSLVTRAQANGLYKAAAPSYIVPPKKGKKPSFSIMPEEKEEKKANAGLTIFVLDGDGQVVKQALDVDETAQGTITENLPELDDEERKKLLNDTVLIKDKRDPHAKSMAYNTQVRLDLSNPDQTGLFEVLEKPGKFDEMLVLVNPQSGRGEENMCTVVRKSDPRAWKNCDRNNLYVRQNRQPTDTDFKKWVEGLDGVTSLKKGGTYIALNEEGGCTAPFRVKEDFGDGNYRVDWEDHIPWSESNWRRESVKDDVSDYDFHYHSWDAKVWINKRKGCKLRAVNGELSIPDYFKILKLKDPPKPPKKKDGTLFSYMGEASPIHDEGESREPPVMPGNIKDVQLMLHKEARQFKLVDIGGNEVWVRSINGDERMSKKAALICLVRDHGLDEHQAREMIKEAAVCAVRQKPAIFLVKYAFKYPLQPGPSAPAIPEPMRGTEQNGYNSVPAQYPQEEFLPVDEMSSYQTDPQIYDPFYQPDQGAMQVAQQASQSGQKEVFDTAMIGGMLKSVRQDSLVDKYLGDLMKALDKLGRILFMFYWHQEEFEDRYGKQDLPELEDSLRNAFEVLGDVCLFLKEKTVQGAHGMDAGEGMGNTDSPDPSIDEAARN